MASELSWGWGTYLGGLSFGDKGASGSSIETMGNKFLNNRCGFRIWNARTLDVGAGFLGMGVLLLVREDGPSLAGDITWTQGRNMCFNEALGQGGSR